MASAPSGESHRHLALRPRGARTPSSLLSTADSLHAHAHDRCLTSHLVALLLHRTAPSLRCKLSVCSTSRPRVSDPIDYRKAARSGACAQVAPLQVAYRLVGLFNPDTQSGGYSARGYSYDPNTILTPSIGTWKATAASAQHRSGGVRDSGVGVRRDRPVSVRVSAPVLPSPQEGMRGSSPVLR